MYILLIFFRFFPSNPSLYSSFFVVLSYALLYKLVQTCTPDSVLEKGPFYEFNMGTGLPILNSRVTFPGVSYNSF